MKAKDVMKKCDICRSTLWRWVKEDKIKINKLPSGHYDYYFESEAKLNNKDIIIYARCSTSGQKENLQRQIERLKNYASANGLIVNKVYSEIASALNYNRKEYRKLIDNIINGTVSKIIIEYKDRILRIGFDDFKFLCEKFNVDLIVIDETNYEDKTKEITDDLISIIHDLGNNSYSNRKINDIIIEINK